MALLQHLAVCIVHDGHGGRCGIADQCTTVRTLDRVGNVLNEHDVCGRCRKRMQLPEWDVDITADGEHRQV